MPPTSTCPPMPSAAKARSVKPTVASSVPSISIRTIDRAIIWFPLSSQAKACASTERCLAARECLPANCDWLLHLGAWVPSADSDRQEMEDDSPAQAPVELPKFFAIQTAPSAMVGPTAPSY